ncbi:pectinesterase/pectinesterase inhibitor PPE8B-like [Capsicum annuum]
MLFVAITLLSVYFICSESQLTETSNAVISHDRFGDRSGDFWTIAEAIQAEPDRSIERYYIKIKQGTYREYIQVAKKKTNIVLIGEGMKTTIIGGNRSFADGNKTFDTGTVGISGNGFTAQDITFRNDAGPRKFQAVALRVESDMVSFYRCRFEGYQDTLYTRRDRHQFYRDCEIYGTVDFICGNARALFQNCLIQAHIPLDKQYNTITAQERDLKDGQTGLVLQNCTIKASRDLEKMDDITTYLGRP